MSHNGVLFPGRFGVVLLLVVACCDPPNAPAPAPGGIVSLTIHAEVLHSRELRRGMPKERSGSGRKFSRAVARKRIARYSLVSFPF